MVSRQHVVRRSSRRDNLRSTQDVGKAHFTRVTEVVGSCQMCWNLHQMQHICNKNIDMYRTFFSSDTGKCPFLRISTSGAFSDEYWMGVLALKEIYSVANIEAMAGDLQEKLRIGAERKSLWEVKSG